MSATPFEMNQKIKYIDGWREGWIDGQNASGEKCELSDLGDASMSVYCTIFPTCMYIR